MIVNDYSVSNIVIPKRKNITNCLILSGGGTNQTFFSCGAVGCIVDNGLFDFEVISVVNPITPIPISLFPPTEKIYRILQAIGYYKMRKIKRKINSVNTEQHTLVLLRFIQQYQPKQYSINDL